MGVTVFDAVLFCLGMWEGEREEGLILIEGHKKSPSLRYEGLFLAGIHRESPSSGFEGQ